MAAGVVAALAADAVVAGREVVAAAGALSPRVAIIARAGAA